MQACALDTMSLPDDVEYKSRHGPEMYCQRKFNSEPFEYGPGMDPLQVGYAVPCLADVSLKRYPKDELAWLATSAFNHAVDLYCADDKELSRSWAENALNLAMAIGQNTGLHAALQAKLLRLQAS